MSQRNDSGFALTEWVVVDVLVGVCCDFVVDFEDLDYGGNDSWRCRAYGASKAVFIVSQYCFIARFV